MFQKIVTFLTLTLMFHATVSYSSSWLEKIPFAKKVPFIKKYINSNSIETKINEAIIVIENKDSNMYEHARALLDEVEKLKPKDHRVEKLRGALKFNEGNYYAAYEYFVKAREIHPNFWGTPSLSFNGGNAISMLAKQQLEKNKDNPRTLKAVAYYLNKAAALYNETIFNTSDKELKKNAFKAREMALREKNRILLKLKNFNKETAQFENVSLEDMHVKECMQPFLSLNNSDQRQIELEVVIGDLSDSSKFFEESLFEEYTCANNDLNLVLSGYNDLSKVLGKNSSITEVDRQIKSIHRSLSLMDTDTDKLRDPKVLLLLYLRDLKGLGDLRFKKSELLKAQGKTYEAILEEEKALTNSYATLFKVINHLFKGINNSSETETSLMQMYPKIFNLSKSANVLVSPKRRVDIENWKDLKQRVRNDSSYNFKSEKQAKIDSFDALSSLKLEYNGIIMSELDRVSRRLVSDSIGMISIIQSRAYRICLKRKGKKHEAFQFEPETLNLELGEKENIESGELTSSAKTDNNPKSQILKNKEDKARSLIALRDFNISSSSKLDLESMKVSEVQMAPSLNQNTNKQVKKEKSTKKKVKSKEEIRKEVIKGIESYTFPNELEGKEYSQFIKESITNILPKLSKKSLLEMQEQLKNKLFTRMIGLELINDLTNDTDTKFEKLITSSIKKDLESYLDLRNDLLLIGIGEREKIIKELVGNKVPQSIEESEKKDLLKTELKSIMNLIGYEPKLLANINSTEDLEEMLEESKDELEKEKAVDWSSASLVGGESGSNNGLSRGFIDDISAGKRNGAEEYFNKNSKSGASLAYLGDNYIFRDSGFIGLKKRINDTDMIPEKRIAINKGDQSISRHIVGPDESIYIQELSIIKEVRDSKTGEDLTQLALSNYNPKLNVFKLPGKEGRDVYTSTYTDTLAPQKLNIENRISIKERYTKSHQCQVDITQDKSLNDLVKKLKANYKKGDDNSQREVVRSLSNWVSENIFYSQSEKTFKEYQKFKKKSSKIDSILDFMLKIKKGDCDVHNSFVGCILVNEFNIPVKLVTGYLGKNNKVTAKSLHGWLNVWYEDTGWERVDATSSMSDDDFNKARFSFNRKNTEKTNTEKFIKVEYENVLTCISRHFIQKVKKEKTLAYLFDDSLLSSEKIKGILKNECDLRVSSKKLEKLLGHKPESVQKNMDLIIKNHHTFRNDSSFLISEEVKALEFINWFFQNENLFDSDDTYFAKMMVEFGETIYSDPNEWTYLIGQKNKFFKNNPELREKYVKILLKLLKENTGLLKFLDVDHLLFLQGYDEHVIDEFTANTLAQKYQVLSEFVDDFANNPNIPNSIKIKSIEELEELVGTWANEIDSQQRRADGKEKAKTITKGFKQYLKSLFDMSINLDLGLNYKTNLLLHPIIDQRVGYQKIENELKNIINSYAYDIKDELLENIRNGGHEEEQQEQQRISVEELQQQVQQQEQEGQQQVGQQQENQLNILYKVLDEEIRNDILFAQMEWAVKELKSPSLEKRQNFSNKVQEIIQKVKNEVDLSDFIKRINKKLETSTTEDEDNWKRLKRLLSFERLTLSQIDNNDQIKSDVINDIISTQRSTNAFGGARLNRPRRNSEVPRLEFWSEYGWNTIGESVENSPESFKVNIAHLKAMRIANFAADIVNHNKEAIMARQVYGEDSMEDLIKEIAATYAQDELKRYTNESKEMFQLFYRLSPEKQTLYCSSLLTKGSVYLDTINKLFKTSFDKLVDLDKRGKEIEKLVKHCAKDFGAENTMDELDDYRSEGFHLVFASLLSIEDRALRMKRFTDLLNSQFFDSNRIYFSRVLDYFLQNTTESNKIKDFIPLLFEKLKSVNINSVKNSATTTVDPSSLVSLYFSARDKDRPRIAKILIEMGIFEHHIMDRSKLLPQELIAKNIKTLKAMETGNIINTETTKEEKEIALLFGAEVLNALNEANANEKEMPWLEKLLEEKINELSKESYPAKKLEALDKQLILIRSKSRKIENTILSNSTFGIIERLDDIRSGWERALRMSEKLTVQEETRSIKMEMIEDFIGVLAKFENIKDDQVLAKLEESSKLIEEKINESSEEDKTDILYMLMSRIYNKSNSSFVDKFLEFQIKELVGRYNLEDKVKVLNNLLNNSMFTSNGRTYALLFKLSFTDELIEKFDQRKSIDRTGLNSYKVLLKGLNYMLDDSPEFSQLVKIDKRKVKQKGVVDLGGVKAIGEVGSSLISSQMEIVNFDYETMESTAKAFKGEFKPKDKTIFLSRAIANNIFAPEIMDSLLSSTPGQLFSKERIEVENNLKIGFVQTWLRNNFHESWVNDTGEQVSLVRLARQFEKLSQKQKLELIDNKGVPFDSKDLRTLNTKLRPLGFSISIEESDFNKVKDYGY